MADVAGYTNEAAVAEAAVIQKNLADSTAMPAVVSKLRLFDGTLVPSVLTTKAQFEAAETTLTGYPPGGYSITVMHGPDFIPGGGAMISSDTLRAVYASGSAVTIGGYWVEDSAGNVRQYYTYNPLRQLARVGDAIPMVAIFGYGRQG